MRQASHAETVSARRDVPPVTDRSTLRPRAPIVPFSPAGDAEVNTVLELPPTCLAPAVFFVGITGTGAERWFAVTGW